MNASANPQREDAANVAALDFSSVKVVREFQLKCAPGHCRFDRQGRFLYIGCEDNGIQQWNCETGELTALHGHSSWVRGFAFPPADEQFVSSGYDGNLIWWIREAPSTRVDHQIQAHRGWIRAIAQSPDGLLLASVGNDRIVRIWSIADRKLLQELTGHEQTVCSVAFHPDGQWLATGDDHCSIKVWDLAKGELSREIDGSSAYIYSKSNRGSSGGFRALLFTADGNQLIGSGVVGGGDPLGQAVNPGLTVFDWSSGERRIFLRARGNESGVAWAATYHSTKQFVTAVSGGLSAKHFYFWKTNEEQPVHVIDLPSPGRSLALHPNGSQLAVALFDGKVQIYSA